MKSKSLIWIVAGIFILALCIAVAPVSAACGEVLLDTYPVNLGSSNTLNVDNGGTSGITDIWWNGISYPSNYRMEILHGARLVNLGSVNFGSITYNNLLGYSYSTAPIDGTNIVAGDAFAVYTNDGNVAKIQVLSKVIDTNHYDLTLWEVLYSCGPAPTFSSISPNSGPMSGGTTVTITGSNFVSGGSFNVYIGGIPATSVHWVDSSHITAVTTSQSAGDKNVQIRNNDGQEVFVANAFTYVAPPWFESITPSSGPQSGDTHVTIKGSNFISGGSFGVTICGNPASSVVRVDSFTITAVTPSCTGNGAQLLVIRNNDGQQTTAAYTYNSPPTFTSISPNSGPTTGGTPVTITGGNFVSGGSFQVYIGGMPATSVQSDRHMVHFLLSPMYD